MSAVASYFHHIAQDFGNLIDPPPRIASSFESRVASLFCRVVGAGLAVSSCIHFIYHAALVTSSPTVAMVGVISACVQAIFAHDFITVGENMRKLNKAIDSGFLQSQNFFQMFFSFGRDVGNLVGAAYYEAQKNVHYSLQGTIVLEPIARIIASF